MNGMLSSSFKGVSPGALREAYRTFRPTLRGQRRGLVAAFLASVGVTIFELLRPWPTKILFDQVLLADPGSGGVGPLGPEVAVLVLAGSVAAISGFSGLLGMWAAVKTAEVGRKVGTRARRQVFEHLHRLDLPFHLTARNGDLLVRLMGDVNLLRDALFASWLAIAERALLFFGVAVILFLLDPLLAVCALLPLPALAIGIGRSSRRLRDVTRKQRRKEGAAAAFASESLRQIHLVKAFSREREASEAFSEQVGLGERAGVKAARISARMSQLTELMTGGGLSLVLLVGALRVMRGHMTPGELLVATSYARTLYKPLRRISREGGRLSKATAATERLLDILRRKPEPAGVGLDVDDLRGEIIFVHARFRYPDGTVALDDMSFAVPEGSLAVLAGPNGSGKSTSLAVLLRLHQLDSGSVLVDGEAIGLYELHSYRRCFAYVPQGIQLFCGSVRDNILYGKPDASDDEIEAAARATFIHDDICAMPDGYDTLLGEEGARLSGGQARRLMLARAAVRDASVVILDEPLAGLDTEARHSVAAAVRSIGAGRTVLVVSHGPSEELSPDLVLHLGAGRVQHLERRATDDGELVRLPARSAT